MRVFVTGATGWVGSAIVPELLANGHQVVGLARSDRAAAALAEAGAEAHHGSLEDLESLRSGAKAADGVIHCAFIHDFSQIEASGRTDLAAIKAIGTVLEGSGRPLVVTSGLIPAPDGRPSTEDDPPDPHGRVTHRVPSDLLALSLAGRGVRSSIVRLSPSVHGEGDHGFVPRLVDIARTKGISAYIGDGANRWPAVHRLDAAHLFRQALEQAPSGSVLHGVADEGVPIREIAEVIGRHLGIPVVSISPEAAAEHFGWLGRFLAADVPASNALTRERFGWHPTQPGLIADLDAGHYFTQPQA